MFGRKNQIKEPPPSPELLRSVFEKGDRIIRRLPDFSDKWHEMRVTGGENPFEIRKVTVEITPIKYKPFYFIGQRLKGDGSFEYYSEFVIYNFYQPVKVRWEGGIGRIRSTEFSRLHTPNRQQIVGFVEEVKNGLMRKVEIAVAQRVAERCGQAAALTRLKDSMARLDTELLDELKRL